MRQLEALKQNFFPHFKLSRRLRGIPSKRILLTLTGLVSLSACTVVPNEGPTGCGLESMDNGLFRDEGCDPITGIISLPSIIPVWIVDYAACGLKWHNSRIAPDFDGKKHRYIRRLRQMKIEAERNQSALEAKKNLASKTLAENAIADRIYALLENKALANDFVPLSMRGNKPAKQLAENAISERFTVALEQILQIQSNLKLAQERALAAMPPDEDLLPALADPGQKEASSYSVLELEKTAWAQVTSEDKARKQAEKTAHLQAKMAKWSPEQRAAYEAAKTRKAQRQQEKLEKKNQKQADLEAKRADKLAKVQAKRQDQLKAKGELEPVPMHPESQPAQPAPKAPKETTAETLPPAAQAPVAPLVRNPETVQPDADLKAQVQAKKSLPIPLDKIKES